ncbi:hypothetical protein RN001_010911 [Aquatica leii]|uniref:Cytochrome b-c1 complex subunit 6 n=1 Tax=Aquatica leii TaxID=1421715 RepID=A0AAN7Q3P4_9COLE|nr:hypothetical protein RN001_010911 [Aquatica leii]
MFFKNLLIRFFPSVKADEDLVDPMLTLREKCKETEHAQHYLEKLEACNNRVNSKKQTTETCTEELFDFLHAVDHCVSKDLFSYLK